MSDETLFKEIRELCDIAGKQVEEVIQSQRLKCTDHIIGKAVIENIDIIDSTETIDSIAERCRQFQDGRTPDERLYLVGLNVDPLSSDFESLPEATRGNVWLLSYFDFVRSFVGLDVVPYLRDQQKSWAEYLSKDPHHIPVKLRRRRGTSISTPEEEFSGVEEYLSLLTNHSDGPNFELCYGEYGVGKSVFILEIENILASRYLADPLRNRLPIRIPLLEYREKSRIEDLVKRTINIEIGPSDVSESPFPSDKIFWRLVEAGRFLFLLDAVDEMAALDSNDLETKRYPILQLLRLHFQNGRIEFREDGNMVRTDLVCGDLLARTRALWTCRTTFFNSYDEIGKDDYVGRVIQKVSRGTDLFVASFDRADVKSKIQELSPKAWDVIRTTFGLEELALTALWFQMILRRVLDRLNKGEEIDSYSLIKEFIDAANERERSEKKRDLNFDRELHEFAIEWLACALHQRRNFPGQHPSQRIGMTFEEMMERLRDYLEISAGSDVEQLLTLSGQAQKLFQAVRLCSFLSRSDPNEVSDADEGYYFYPEPFESYFVAKRLLEKDYKAHRLLITEYLKDKRLPVGEGVTQFLFRQFCIDEATGQLPDDLNHKCINGWVEFPPGLFVFWDQETGRDYMRVEERFAIREHPVTVKEYGEFLNANPGTPRPEHWATREYSQFCPSDDCPVVNLRFEEAKRYCEWLAEKEQAIVQLPSEQQWQRAARGMDGRTYHWGLTLPESPADIANGSEYWGRQGLQARTTPVGSFEPKPFGLCDIIGNVWEYLRNEVGERVVVRGASFYVGKERWKLRGHDLAEQCKDKVKQSEGSWEVGFRPVRIDES